MNIGSMVLILAIAPVQAAGTVGGDQGAPVELMVMREVTGEHAVPGAEVKLIVNKPVVLVDGTIPQGTRAFGEVVRASRSGMAMRAGMISIRLTRLVISGHDVPISGGATSRGTGGEADSLVKVLFVPLYVLFSPGNVGKIKAGQIVEAHLPPAFKLTSDTMPAQ